MASAAAWAALASALVLAGCGEDGSDGSRAHAPTAAGATPADASPAPSEPDAAPTTDRLDLAVLAPLPEFARADGAARTPPPGHVAAHGSLDDLAPLADGESPDRAAPIHLTWSALDAPGYEEPLLMASGERPSLAEVLDPVVLAADGRRVVLDGFGTVEEDDGAGRTTALLLTPLPPACCLGRFPGASERVHVRVPAALDLTVDPWAPLRLTGTLTVEERRDGLGLFEGLYFFEVEGLVEVEGLEAGEPAARIPGAPVDR